MQYLTRMKMNQFLLDRVIDKSNTKTLNIQPDSLDETEKIFMNLAVQDNIIEIEDKTVILTTKGSAYLEFLIKNKTNSIRVGLK